MNNRDILPTIKQLSSLERWPKDDNLCLDILWKNYSANLTECPKCHRAPPKFYKIENRRCWTCGKCKVHLSPTTGTLFHKSRTPLSSWFLAIKLLYQSDGLVPALEIARQTNVTYKTAWRIKDQLCRYLDLNTEKRYTYKFSSKKNLGGRNNKKYIEKITTNLLSSY